MSNIRNMPINGHANSNDDVVIFLRALAANIEDGNSGDVNTVVILIEHAKKITTLASGSGGIDNARVMGLMGIAQSQYMRGQES